MEHLELRLDTERLALVAVGLDLAEAAPASHDGSPEEVRAAPSTSSGGCAIGREASGAVHARLSDGPR